MTDDEPVMVEPTLHTETLLLVSTCMNGMLSGLGRIPTPEEEVRIVAIARRMADDACEMLCVRGENLARYLDAYCPEGKPNTEA
jgi:hypothetical protein